MAQNEYYTYETGSVNGQISMNVCVFDTIVKERVKKVDTIQINTSYMKKKLSCTIDDNEVFIELHLIVDYGSSVSRIVNDLQRDIANEILEITGVAVNQINIIVDDIDFK